MDDEIELPPLPEPTLLMDCAQSFIPGFTADQMREYALRAVRDEVEVSVSHALWGIECWLMSQREKFKSDDDFRAALKAFNERNRK